MTKLKRGGKKFVTLVEGLELFGKEGSILGIDLKEAAKALRKKLACGTSAD